MGRQPLFNRITAKSYRGFPGMPQYCQWAIVVGDRIRRLRQARDWALVELSTAVQKPEGGGYSPGYFSRIERGWGAAPLYVYLATADVFEVDPARLLGPDSAQLDASEAEMTLIRWMRIAELSPEEALARLARPQ